LYLKDAGILFTILVNVLKEYFMKELGFKELEKNIETTIYEGILKLGYNPEEALSIYYDLDLLNYLLQKDFPDNSQCLDYLQEFTAYVSPRLYNIKILLEKGRFKFTVPKEGIAYIYSHNQNNNFLKELIQMVKSHNFTLDDVLTIFSHYSNEIICEEIDNSEFQYVIYFKDNNIDRFKYCFSFDEMGGYYHRLLDFSFKNIIEE
jgi:hypothetical protein